MWYEVECVGRSGICGIKWKVWDEVCHAILTLISSFRLESLRTLILSDNSLSRIQLTTDDVELTDTDENDWNIVGTSKVRLMFPNLSMLDISNNCLKVSCFFFSLASLSLKMKFSQEIPSNLYELSNLSVLNISGNIDITDLPANMGLLSRLWNLNTKGCSIQGPLHSMIESGKYKTMDIIGYLKSIFEDAKAYARMKLMVVGVQGIGSQREIICSFN